MAASACSVLCAKVAPFIIPRCSAEYAGLKVCKR